jgi:hypothetical protein
MATSGSYDYNNTGTEIITAALRKCGVIAEGETPTAQMLADGLEDLERLTKAWQAAGIRLWKYEEMVLFLETSKQSYNLGPSGDRIVKKSALTTTALAADASDTATSITVDSATGFNVSDQIGIVMDDNTIHWTTISTIVGTTITIASGIDDDAADDNAVYVFTSKAPRPLQVTHGRVQLDTSSETVLNVGGREDYFSLANKSASGTPTDIYYNPTLTNGKLYVYPTVSDERQYLNLTTQIPIEDFDAASNDPDFPQEWFMPLVWNVAAQMYLEYGVNDPITVQKIEKEAEKWYEFVSGFDNEEADIVIEVNYGL